MDPTHAPPSPGSRGWGYAAVAVVAVMLVGGGWLVAAGLSDPTPTLAVPAAETAVPPTDDDREGLAGFATTSDGAAAAAAAAVAALGRPEVLFDDDRLDRLASVLFVEAEVRPQLAEVAVARQGFARSGWDEAPAARRSYFSTPIAVRVTDSTRSDAGGLASAVVEVWSVTVVTIGDVGGALYTTSTVSLTADDTGRWWVSGLDSVEGPTPALAGTPTVPGAYRSWLRDIVPTVPTPVDPAVTS